jgi:acyl carrier protein phosphodiesterase
MNWLAHLLLSEDDAASRVGALAADWVKGHAREALDPDVRRGMARHAEIDGFTDAHPVVRLSRSRIRPPQRRFAGVLVDVFYDHFLALDWDRYCAAPLGDWTRGVYGQLAAYSGPLPPGMREGFRRMAEDDWLGSYAAVDGIDATLRRMSRRLKRPTPLADAADELVASYEGFREDFRAFFPDLRRHVYGSGIEESPYSVSEATKT